MGRRLRVVLVGCLLAAGLQLTVGAPAAQAGVGARDTTYGTNGESWVDTAFADARVLDTRAMADGSTVTAAWVWHRVPTTPPAVEHRLAIIRLATDGTLRSITRTPLPGISASDLPASVAEVGADGSVVVAGRASTAGPIRLLLARFRPDGSLDPAFGDGGTLTRLASDCGGTAPTDVVTHPDGAITLLERYSDLAGVLRLSPTGAVDTSFGDQGCVTLHAPLGFAQTIALAAGTTGRTLYVARGFSEPPEGAAAPTLQRWLGDGTVDETYAGGGTLTLPGFGRALAPRADGSVTLLVGHSQVARVRSDGTFDPAFDGDGVTARLLPTDYGTPQLSDLAVHADGSVLARGTSADWWGVLAPDGSIRLPFQQRITRFSEVDLDVVGDQVVVTGTGVRGPKSCCTTGFVAAYRVGFDGAADATYGSGGTSFVEASFGGSDHVLDSWTDALGRLVIVTAFDQMWAVSRLLADGSLDRSFGADGIARIATPTPQRVIETSDGGFAAVGLGRGGYHDPAVPQTTLVQRFDGAGRLLASFGTGGQVHLDAAWWGDRPPTIAEVPVGRLAVVQAQGLTLLTATGAPDPTFDGDGSMPLADGSDTSFQAPMAFDGVGLVYARSDSVPWDPAIPPYRTTLRRLLLTGTPDPTFGTDGSVDVTGDTVVDELVPAGVAGAVGALYVVARDGLVDKLLPGGGVDPTFTRVPKVDSGAQVTVDGLGRLLVVGGSYAPERAIRRHLPTGAPDLAFGDDGRLKVEVGFPYRAHAVAGRVLVVGTSDGDAWVLAIRDSEPGLPTATLEGTTIVEGEHGSLRVRLDRPGEAAVHLTLRGTDGTGQTWASTAYVPRGATTATVPLSPPEDALYEGDEVTHIQIVDADQAEFNSASVTYTIQDDDPVGDAPGTPKMTLLAGNELRFWSDAARPGASTPTLMTVMVFDGDRLAWHRHVNGDRGRVQLPQPRSGKALRVYVAGSNPQGTGPLAGPITYGASGYGPTLPRAQATNTRSGVLVKWTTDLFGPDLVFTPAVIWSVIVTSADGREVLHAANFAEEQRGTLITDLPKDRDVKVLLVGWYHSGPVVSEAVSLDTSSNTTEPYLGATHAPTDLELARRGAAPSVMWKVEPATDLEPAIEAFVVKVRRGGSTISTREYPPTVRNAPLVPSEIGNGATVEVWTKTAWGTAASDPIPAAWR